MWDEILKKYRGWERVRPIHGVFFIWAFYTGDVPECPGLGLRRGITCRSNDGRGLRSHGRDEPRP